MKKIVQFLGISLFFIGFPLVSWYYLNKGYDYRVTILAELKEALGEAPDFQLLNQKGEWVDKESMKNNVVIANFISLNDIEQSRGFISDLYKIQDQFDKKDDILFYTFIKADSLQAVQSYCQSLKIKEEKQWHFLTGEEQKMEEYIKAYPFPDNIQKIYEGNPTVAIADTNMIIRHFYNMNKPKEVSRLIEHIANLMPQAPPGEARMKRELEK